MLSSSSNDFFESLCSLSSANADSSIKVSEYLSKKGYSRTEAMLRVESSAQDAEGNPLIPPAENTDGSKYGKALGRYQSENYISHLFVHTKPINSPYAYMDRRRPGCLQGKQGTEST